MQQGRALTEWLCAAATVELEVGTLPAGVDGTAVAAAAAAVVAGVDWMFGPPAAVDVVAVEKRPTGFGLVEGGLRGTELGDGRVGGMVEVGAEGEGGWVDVEVEPWLVVSDGGFVAIVVMLIELSIAVETLDDPRLVDGAVDDPRLVDGAGDGDTTTEGIPTELRDVCCVWAKLPVWTVTVVATELVCAKMEVVRTETGPEKVFVVDTVDTEEGRVVVEVTRMDVEVTVVVRV